MSILLKRLAARVFSAAATATGTLVSRGCVVRGVHYNDTSGGQAGTLVLRDGGGSGTVRLTVNTPGGGVGMDVSVPAGGIAFDTDVHATLTNVDGVTVFYE